MSNHRNPNSRHTGQSIIRSTTGVVATAAIVGTGSLAFFVSHAYAGKAAGTSTTSTPSAGSAAQTPTDLGDDQYQGGYQQQYGDPYAQQGSQGSYAPQPASGGQPQASTGGS